MSAPVIRLPGEFNVATWFVDRNVLEGRGNKVAIECGDERVTYAQLLERTNRLGNALCKLNVRREERVQLILLDTPEFLYSFFGAIKMGAVAVPTNTLLKPHDNRYLFNATGARVAIVSQPLLPAVQAIPRAELSHLETIIVVGRDAEGCFSFHELLDAASPELDAAPTGKDDPAFWLYSSGSTGPPKGCVHLHHDMVVCAESYAKAVLGIREDDRCYSVARLFFAYGLGNAGYFPLAVGATSILSPQPPAPDHVFATIERHRPTLFFSVPTSYAALLNHRPEGDAGGDFDLSSIRHAVSAGEALPAALFERFRERFGVEILDAVGSTEALHMFIANRPGEARPGSSGKTLPGYEARIVDDAGQPVPIGEVGNLLIQGGATCSCYWGMPEKSAETFADGWLRTGDKYYQDPDGYFWYVGRSDDLFKVSGSWVSPFEVEAALVRHPAVLEAAVVAREDADRLLKPAAYVALRPPAVASAVLAAELQDFVAGQLAGFKRPRWVEFLPELPKTATGKLQRFKLRERR
ncbi:MAG: benzoate-CoA ligase family protein [Acidobacteria bacterium]|nr:benzoate-CoA ligase family protein [Acidobacteriota bacterium]